ncbi:MAG: ABC transporter permease [Candidatus Saccharibacteria bacterium]
MLLNIANPVLVLWKREMIRIWRDKTQLVMLVLTPLIMGIIGCIIIDYSLYDDSRLALNAMLILAILINSFTVGSSIVIDKQSGVIKDLLTAPVTRAYQIVSRTLAGSVTSALTSLLVMVGAPLIGVKISLITVLMLFGAVILITLTLSTLSVLIGVLTSSVSGYYSISAFLVLTMLLLSNALFIVSPNKFSFAGAVLLNPALYGSDLTKHALGLHGDYIASASITALIGFTIIFGSIAVYLLNRKTGKGDS